MVGGAICKIVDRNLLKSRERLCGADRTACGRSQGQCWNSYFGNIQNSLYSFAYLSQVVVGRDLIGESIVRQSCKYRTTSL